jgi:hypothetical protein
MKQNQLFILVGILMLCCCSSSMAAIAYPALSSEEGSTGPTGPSGPSGPPEYRYVKILRDKAQHEAAGIPWIGNHHLNLMEVKVFSGGVNVALSAPTTASSRHAGIDPMKLTDGLLTTMAHTETDEIEWFQIDLGQEYPIDKVEVYNRSDSDSAMRAQGVKIQISNSADMSNPIESDFVSVSQAAQETPKLTWIPTSATITASAS